MSKRTTTRTTRSTVSSSSRNATGEAGARKRSFIVVVTLIGVLTATSALLLALSRPPLTPDAASTLYAVGAPDSLDVIFQTKVPATPTRWSHIYIHHSRTNAGSAMSLSQANSGLADHFVIGNGEGCGDGEIQVGQRWNQQLSAGQFTEAEIDPACISICVIGDFDHSLPTSAQMRHLTLLVNTLQSRLKIPSNRVLMFDQNGSSAAIGDYFPAKAFQTRLLP